MRNICIVTPVPPRVGGIGVLGVLLADLLRSEGVPVTVVPSIPEIPKLLEILPVVRPLVRYSIFLYRLLRDVKEGDVIHHLTASGRFFYLSAPVIWIGHWRKCRVIINYHGANAEQFWRESAKWAVPLLKKADVSMVASRYIGNILAKYGIDSVIIPNWTDISRFSFRERLHFGPNLLYSREIDPKYHVEGVLNAFRHIQERYPQATLGIVGTGSELSRIKCMAADMGLRSVTFYGRVPHRELPAIFDQYDFLLNCTLIDNYPNAMLEATCRGLINVAYGSGGIPYMIRNGETGILVPIKDDLALAEGVMRMIENQDSARSMALRARQWAVEQHAWPKLFSALMCAYGIDQASQPEARPANELSPPRP